MADELLSISVLWGLKQHFLVSKAMLASQFCAFELGYARAKGIPMRLISLDGSLPPSYLQERQTTDLLRLQMVRPWLEISELLAQEILRSVKKL